MIIISNITLLRCLYNKQQTQAEINLIIQNLIKKQTLFWDFCFVMFYSISGKKKTTKLWGQGKTHKPESIMVKDLYLPDLRKTDSDKISFSSTVSSQLIIIRLFFINLILTPTAFLNQIFI